MCVGPAIGVDTVRKAIMIRPVAIMEEGNNDEFTSAAGCANQQNRTVMMPIRKPNAELRTLEFLTQAEIDKLIDATKWNRWGHRDAT
jgi:hypothetical protein